MTFLEFLDVASAVSRVSASVSVPLVGAYAAYNWHKGHQLTAIYLLGWTIFLKQISGN